MGQIRDRRHSDPGQAYAAVWLEWWVRCAREREGCEAHACVAEMCDDVQSARVADKLARERLPAEGWRLVAGCWYCPAHAPA